jgi:hypothetical protein
MVPRTGSQVSVLQPGNSLYIKLAWPTSLNFSLIITLFESKLKVFGLYIYLRRTALFLSYALGAWGRVKFDKAHVV